MASSHPPSHMRVRSSEPPQFSFEQLTNGVRESRFLVHGDELCLLSILPSKAMFSVLPNVPCVGQLTEAFLDTLGRELAFRSNSVAWSRRDL